MTLTQKETGLLKDLKDQEKLCVDKYTKHAMAAHDPQLKKLFEQIASVEQKHLQMLDQIATGTVPTYDYSMPTSSGFSAVYAAGQTQDKQADAYLCSDLLATEKHAASLYNTCVFEFEQPALRRVLNQIQTDEQWHGEQIYKYMKTNGMYS